MNIYDFDGTIYDGDSSIDFFLFCAKRKPIIFLLVPRIFAAFAIRLVRKANTETVKSTFFSFVRMIPDIDLFVSEFWKTHSKKIMGWYLAQKKSDDVIISASPEFLLEKIGDELGVRVIASRVCKKSGALLGKNCRGEEKVVRFHEEFGTDCTIENFYSDSKSDFPLARLAQNAWLCERGKITPWNKNNGK
ncbi:MAG: HAD-IB family phosphatase [Treponema sp.]|nr:HAD-IB family phosphatase [Treponema sp.]